MKQRVYECRINNVSEVKQLFVEVWNSLQQNVIDAASNEWRHWERACMQMVNIFNTYCEHVWLTKVIDELECGPMPNVMAACRI